MVHFHKLSHAHAAPLINCYMMAKLCFPADVWMRCNPCIIADSSCVCGNIYLYCSPWLFSLPETVDLVMRCLFTNDEMHVYVVFHVGANAERKPLFC